MLIQRSKTVSMHVYETLYDSCTVTSLANYLKHPINKVEEKIG